MKTIFKIFGTAFVLSIALLLNGCETTAGFGKDLQKGGASLQKAAEQEKSENKK